MFSSISNYMHVTIKHVMITRKLFNPPHPSRLHNHCTHHTSMHLKRIHLLQTYSNYSLQNHKKNLAEVACFKGKLAKVKTEILLFDIFSSILILGLGLSIVI